MTGAVRAPSAPLRLPGGAVRRLREDAWRYPEWWALLLAAGAWGWMAVRAGGHSSAHAGHGAASPVWDASGLAVMVVAMMTPLVIAPVRHVALHSLWRRRQRAIAGFLAGYLGVWVVMTGALAGGWVLLASVAGDAAGLALVVAAAVGWEVAPGRRRRARRCERTVPLAPRGWRADRDCVTFGASSAVRCAGTCWGLMAVCVAADHALPVMAILFGLQLSTRYNIRPSPVLSVAGICVAAVVARG